MSRECVSRFCKKATGPIRVAGVICKSFFRPEFGQELLPNLAAGSSNSTPRDGRIKTLRQVFLSPSSPEGHAGDLRGSDLRAV